MNLSELKTRVGNRIKELRTQKSRNQSQLTQAMKKDRQLVERIENGKVNPGLYLLYEIANALEVNMKDIVNFY